MKNGILVATISCDWKCLIEQGLDLSICQNCHTSKFKTRDIYVSELINMFNANLLSDCIIFAGLEPILQFDEILSFVEEFRKTNADDIVIYTGYYPNEIPSEIERLKGFSNIIIKFGRFVANSESIYDKVLGVKLASKNQYAKRIEDL